MRGFGMNIVLLSALALSSLPVLAADNSATTSCNFEDGKQLSVRYIQAAAKGKNEPSPGKLWTPNKQPLLLFTSAELSAATSDIPVGAYSMYIRGGKESWTLIVNKNVAAGASYDEHQDLAHINMPLAPLGQPQNQFTLAFAQVSPKQCTLRIYYGMTGTWADFHEK